MSDYGILSILPALLVITLALVTKKTVFSLIVGLYAGSLILNSFNPLTAFPNLLSNIVMPAMQNTGMLLLVAASGGFIYMIKSSGAGVALGDFAKRHIKSRKGAQTATWCASFALLYTEPHLTLGTIMRPITERFRISRVKLAYMCDSLATIASISPICACAPYISGLIEAQLDSSAGASAWGIYLHYIPYNFYALFAIITVLIVARTGLDIGPMYHAEQRAITTGELIGPNDVPIIEENPEEAKLPAGAKVSLLNIIIPMLTLFLTIFAVIFWSGDLIANGIPGVFFQADITLAITCGMLMGSVGAGIMAILSKVCTASQALQKWEKGIIDITSVNIILILAWSLGSILDELGVKLFIVNVLTEVGFPPVLIPAVVFLVGACTSFATGSSWGTWAILIPIVYPLAVQFGLPPELVIASAISGGLFGDHCSPISDTTIMSSTVSGCDHVQHVRTQLPYGLTVAFSCLCGFLVSGITENLFSGLAVTAVVLAAALIVLHRISMRKERSGSLT